MESRKKKRKRAEVETSQNMNMKKKKSKIFRFDGKVYKTYSAMVDAKRERNRIWLEKSGVQEATQQLKKAKMGQQSGMFRQQEHTLSKQDEDATTNCPIIYDTKATPNIETSKFGHQVFDFEQMTTESCAKKQLNVDDGSSDTETVWEDEKIKYI